MVRATQQIVVVVDDDSQVREAIEGLLKSAEFGPVAFSSAESALASGLLAQSKCLITDVRLEGMQGLDLQRQVKDAYPMLPVIIITGHLDEEIRQSALSDGAVAVLYKPLNPDDLLQAIHVAIANSNEVT